LYHEVSGELLGAADERPLVILLEDLHWADDSTLGLLRSLGQERRAALIIACTFRDTEITPELTDTLAALARSSGHVRISLRGLSVDSVADLAAQTGGDRLDMATAEALRERTDGNPFFVSELVKLWASQGRLKDEDRPHDVPLAVGDVIRSRVARLPADTQAVLTLAAAAGRTFDLSVVATAAAIEEDHLVDLIDGAMVTGVLTDDPDSSHRAMFCHDLVRETIYQSLSGLRRARLHRRVAEAFAAQPDGAKRYVSELAYHYTLAASAGTAQQGLQYNCDAARQAGAQGANAEAARYWRAAFLLLDTVGADMARRYEVLVGMALAERLIPDGVASRVHFREAAELAEAAGEILMAAEAAIAGGSALGWNWTGYAQDDAYMALLQRLLRAVPDDNRRVSSLLLSSLALEQRVSVRDDVSSTAAAALALARKLDDQEVTFGALHASFAALHATPDALGRLALANEMTSLTTVPAGARATAYLARIQARLETADLDVEDDLVILDRLAEESFQPAIQSYTDWNRSLLVIASGPMDVAERLMQSSLERNVLRELGEGWMPFYTPQLLVVRWLQGRIGELEPFIPSLAENPTPGFRESAALVLASGGRANSAKELLEDGDGSLRPLVHDLTYAVNACGRAEALALIGDPVLAAEAYEDLKPYRGLMSVLTSGVCLGAIDFFLGRLAATAGQPEAAVKHLRAGLELNDRSGVHTIAVVNRVRLGELVESLGDPQGAALIDEGRRAGLALGVAI
jgi:hypothetical protein